MKQMQQQQPIASTIRGPVPPNLIHPSTYRCGQAKVDLQEVCHVRIRVGSSVLDAVRFCDALHSFIIIIWRIALFFGGCVFQYFLFERRLLGPHHGVDFFPIDQKDKEGQGRGSVEIRQVGRLVDVHIVQHYVPVQSCCNLGIVGKSLAKGGYLLADTAPVRREF
jgi:hypothetical protein